MRSARVPGALGVGFVVSPPGHDDISGVDRCYNLFCSSPQPIQRACVHRHGVHFCSPTTPGRRDGPPAGRSDRPPRLPIPARWLIYMNPLQNRRFGGPDALFRSRGSVERGCLRADEINGATESRREELGHD